LLMSKTSHSPQASAWGYEVQLVSRNRFNGFRQMRVPKNR